MIILDTNVVSEIIVDSGGTVAQKVASRREPVYITTVTLAELWYGVELMQVGQRRQSLEERINVWVGKLGAEMLLPLDAKAAEPFGRLRADRRKMGRPIPFADAAIAAICARHQATLYTRNTKDFDHTGIALFNPWID